VSSAGNFNGDIYDDIVIGGVNRNGDGMTSGVVIYGSPYPEDIDIASTKFTESGAGFKVFVYRSFHIDYDYL